MKSRLTRSGSRPISIHGAHSKVWAASITPARRPLLLPTIQANRNACSAKRHAEVRAYLVQQFLWISGGEIDYDRAVVLANQMPFCDGSSIHGLSSRPLQRIYGVAQGQVLHSSLSQDRDHITLGDTLLPIAAVFVVVLVIVLAICSAAAVVSLFTG